MALRTSSVTVDELLRQAPEPTGLDLELLGGAGGLGRSITLPYIQKTGLALAGFDAYLRPGRILVFGESEIRFVEGLADTARRTSLRRTVEHDIPCILVTGGFKPPTELIEEADRAAVPVLRTGVITPIAIAKVTDWLEDRLAVREVIHGVLLDVLGLGVLVIGESGIGKSECALDLVVRGHRLVADDAVEVHRRGESIIIGRCPSLTRYHMEIRGLGLINIRDLFGVASTRSSKRVEFVVLFERWDPSREYERLGLDEAWHEILNVKTPLVRMPVAPGRNLAILVEVAARNQLLKARGRHAARELVARLDQQLATPGSEDVDEPDDDTGGME